MMLQITLNKVLTGLLFSLSCFKISQICSTQLSSMHSQMPTSPTSHKHYQLLLGRDKGKKTQGKYTAGGQWSQTLLTYGPLFHPSSHSHQFKQQHPQLSPKV